MASYSSSPSANNMRERSGCFPMRVAMRSGIARSVPSAERDAGFSSASAFFSTIRPTACFGPSQDLMAKHLELESGFIDELTEIDDLVDFQLEVLIGLAQMDAEAEQAF